MSKSKNCNVQTSGRIALSDEDKILNTEMIQNLYLVYSSQTETYWNLKLHIETCPLYIINNAFIQGSTEIKNEINLDQLPIDMKINY